jgi:hypothetical protein
MMSDLPNQLNSDDPREALKLYWQRLVAADKAIHEYIARRHPVGVALVDRLAEGLHNFFSAAAFAVLLALVLVVLVGSSLVSLTIGVSCVLLWLVAVVWLSRANWLRQLTIPIRAVAILIAAGVLAFGCFRFRNWSLHNYLEQQIAGKHDVPVPLTATPELTARPVSPQPALPPRRATEARLDLMFKDSSLFTSKRREAITEDVNQFAAYLEALGLPIPTDIPPIGIDTTNPKLAGWSFNEQTNNKYYYNKFTLQQGMLDDRQKITEAFCSFVVGRFLYKPPPQMAPLSDKQTPQQFYDSTHTPEQMDQTYRWMANTQLTQYLNHSYWNQRFAKNQQPVCPDQGDGTAYYFWEIRARFGKEFTDRLAVFTLRAVVDKPYVDPTQTHRQYFYERLRMADSVIDNENAKMAGIDAILKECGWLEN